MDTKADNKYDRQLCSTSYLHVKYENRGGYLYCYVSGVTSIQFCIDYLVRISDECKQRGYNKVLVAEYLQGNLSAKDIYTMCRRLPHLFRGVKLAFVDMDTTHYFKKRFAERIARDKGCDTKLFYDEKEAENWLRGD